MLPSGFFVVTGSGVSDVSKLNAFDMALSGAGISQCNLVEVSSILPENARQVKPRKFLAGEIVFCVLARADGIEGETISAGVAWGKGRSESGESYGLVAEDSGVKKLKYLNEDLQKNIYGMADSRGMRLAKVDYKTSTLPNIPGGCYGSAIAALVYVFD